MLVQNDFDFVPIKTFSYCMHCSTPSTLLLWNTGHSRHRLLCRVHSVLQWTRTSQPVCVPVNFTGLQIHSKIVSRSIMQKSVCSYPERLQKCVFSSCNCSQESFLSGRRGTTDAATVVAEIQFVKPDQRLELRVMLILMETLSPEWSITGQDHNIWSKTPRGERHLQQLSFSLTLTAGPCEAARRAPPRSLRSLIQAKF